MLSDHGVDKILQGIWVVPCCRVSTSSLLVTTGPIIATLCRLHPCCCTAGWVSGLILLVTQVQLIPEIPADLVA
jgi:hypothetical protein